MIRVIERTASLTIACTPSVHKCTKVGTSVLNQRLLQCEKCFRIFNRDTCASFVIAQIGEHILIHRQHPFRAWKSAAERAEDKGKGRPGPKEGNKRRRL